MSESTTQARQRLEALRELVSLAPSPAVPTHPVDAFLPPAQLAARRRRYVDSHPDVLRFAARIEAQLDPAADALAGARLGQRADMVRAATTIRRTFGYEAFRQAVDRAAADALADLAEAAVSRPEVVPELRRISAKQWLVTFGDAVAVPVPHARGLEDLARVLERDNKEATALELYRGPGRKADESETAAVASGDLSGSLEPEPVVDAEYIADVERGIAAFREQGKNDEADKLDTWLRAQKGRTTSGATKIASTGDGVRKLDDPAETARQAVTKRMREAIATLPQQLGVHLLGAAAAGARSRGSLSLGKLIAYRPLQQVHWRVYREVPAIAK